MMLMRRRPSPRSVIITAIFMVILLCIYYMSFTSDIQQTVNVQQHHDEIFDETNRSSKFIKGKSEPLKKCPKLTYSQNDIITTDVFQNFEFEPTWMRSKEYWDKTFEDRYERLKMDPYRPPLKVIIVPHSHNDPGWLKTFESYFHVSSKQIMSNIVAKLQEYQNLTFIWTEIAFLNSWWEEAHPSKQRALRKLLDSGRLEIATGGWVMTDEANVHLFAMIDQLIEGHQWLWTNVGIKPKTGWSVDPFGHGSTVPYLLAAAGLNGTVIQRIHYAWKQWLALKQYGDFYWTPSWQWPEKDNYATTILTHNQPFDIYSIKHSCGPHPYICLNFDFRKVQGEYTEYSLKAQTITEKNVKEKAELLLDQYARTGSLFPHNVVLMPLGDDFRYNFQEEFDQQYTNYVKLINYINEHKDQYKAEITFGTPLTYFKEITQRHQKYPTLRGDFFVYSDIFSEGRPAYWSGYYTTRPFLKILDREVEHNLRSAEILFTVAYNKAKQDLNKSQIDLKVLEKDFEKLIRARRHLALFQHHDAITGTSKSFVMKDYGLKLFEAIRDTVNVQQNSIETLLFIPNQHVASNIKMHPNNRILSDIERESFDKLPNKTTIQIGPNSGRRKIVVFNSLAYSQEYVITLIVNTTNIRVITDDTGTNIEYQINPILEVRLNKYLIEYNQFELIFIAKLDQLSITTYYLEYSNDDNHDKLATLYCKNCEKKNISSKNEEAQFEIKDIPTSDIQLENQKMKLLFSGSNGFLKSITRKHKPKVMQCKLQFAAYRSAQFHSGAYLFMPDPNERDYEKDILLQYKEQMSIIIASGTVTTELLTIYGPFLVHKTTIYLNEQSALSNAIHIENTIDFEAPPKNREMELFMRISTDIQNGEPPEFYTDQNGFNLQKRIKVERIGLEGNYFPITTMALIQDDSVRMSLLTNHAQGAASWQPGFLEVMLDRRTLYDDSRGMGEGLVDNRRTTSKYWLIIEDINQEMINAPIENENENVKPQLNDIFEDGEVIRSFNVPTSAQLMKNQQTRHAFPRPSLYANHLSNALNYPAQIYIIDDDDLKSYGQINQSISGKINLFNSSLPCDFHLINLRTQPDFEFTQFPSVNSLMILHRQGYDCSVNTNYTCEIVQLKNDIEYFNFINVKEMEVKSLTGLETLETLENLSRLNIAPMSIKTINVTFGL